MNIDDLSKRWFSVKDDANASLVNAIKSHGGSYHFVEEDDERLDEIDDLSELGLPLVDAYTYYQGKQGSFYVISVILGERGLEIYGVDEYNCIDVTDAIQLDHVSLGGILDILENIPEPNEK